MCRKKKQIKFKNYKICSEATHLENRINYLEINKINIDSFFCYKRRHKEFIKSNKLIIKTQQRFKSESHIVFTEEVNKIGLIPKDDKRMLPIASIKRI